MGQKRSNRIITDPREIISVQGNDTYFPISDGVVRTVHNYASVMNRVSEAYVLCPSQKGDFDDSTLPYDVIRSTSVKLPVMDYALSFPLDPVSIRKVVQRGADIVHIHSPFMTGTSLLAAARILKVPAVATFHSKFYSDVYQVTKSRFLSGAVTDVIVGFFNLCDSVWACSEMTAETLRSYGYKKKITVMPNGCDMKEPENIEEHRARACALFGLTPDRITLLFTGSLIWQKNLKTILESYSLLESKVPGRFRLVLAGTGNHEKEIKAFAKKTVSDPEGVIFTGDIHDRDLLAGLYSAADLFFFPSLYDNAPLVVREAAALKTPTLAVRGSNTSEVIIPDVNGFVAKNSPKSMAGKILQITKDKTALQKAGEAAAQTIPVPWEEIVNNVYEKYYEIISRK